MKIYCSSCNCYCGEIRQGNLIKGLKYICPSCQTKKKSDEGLDYLKNVFGMKG